MQVTISTLICSPHGREVNNKTYYHGGSVFMSQ